MLLCPSGGGDSVSGAGEFKASQSYTARPNFKTKQQRIDTDELNEDEKRNNCL